MRFLTTTALAALAWSACALASPAPAPEPAFKLISSTEFNTALTPAQSETGSDKLTIYIARTDDLFEVPDEPNSEAEEHLLLERMSHVVFRTEVDRQTQMVKINDHEFPLPAPGSHDGVTSESTVHAESYRFPSSTGHAAVSPMQLMELTHEIAPGIVKAAVRVHSELMHKEGQKKDVEVRSVGVSVKVTELDGQALERIIALEVPLVQLVVKASPSVSGCSIMHTHEPSTLPAALRPHTLALPFAHPGGPDASMPPFMHPPHGHGPHRSPGRLLQAFLDKLNKWGADNAGEYIKLSSKPHGKRPCPGAMHRAGQRPHSFKYPHGHGPAMLTYDARGNLVTVPSPRPWWGLHRQNAPYKHVSGLRALWRHLGPLAQLGLCFFVTLILSLTPILFIRAIRSANGYSAAQAGGAYARLPNGQALLPPRYEDMTESKLVNYEPTQLTVIVEDVDAEEKAEAGL